MLNHFFLVKTAIVLTLGENWSNDPAPQAYNMYSENRIILCITAHRGMQSLQFQLEREKNEKFYFFLAKPNLPEG